MSSTGCSCAPICCRNHSPENRPRGGLKAIAFVLANETFERLAVIGLFANFMVYLVTQLHMDHVSASNVLNIWYGVSHFAPLIGAFIADAYVGRFYTIAFASFFVLLGTTTVTLTAWLPQLHPAPCPMKQQITGLCPGPTRTHIGALVLGLVFLTIGTGGIRPCSIPFGVDQYDPRTGQGRKGIASFFIWYYYTFTLVFLTCETVVVYVQEKVSWVIGFGIPTIFMAVAIVVFFSGSKLYVRVEPDGSPFTSIARVFVAAVKNRRIKIRDEGVGRTVLLYDPPVARNVLFKLPRTKEYRFFDKAAVITADGGVREDGTPAKKWRLCSVQHVEELKCLIRIIPIWFCGMISLTAMVPQWTFSVSQAIVMDRRLGPHFEVPAGTISSVISLLTIVIFLPIYDRLMVPALRRLTGHEDGLTVLRRIGIGIFFSILSMFAAGAVEKARRDHALAHPAGPALSAFWMSPFLVLMGLCEAFNMIGQIDFFNRQFPEHMRSVGNAMFPCSLGGASYTSAALINAVRRATVSDDLPGGWLSRDLNKGRYDYFYYLLGVLGVVNLALFLFCSIRFRYKGTGATGAGGGGGGGGGDVTQPNNNNRYDVNTV